MNNSTKSHPSTFIRSVIYLMLFTLSTGIIYQIAYNLSPKKVIDMNQFEEVIFQKQTEAENRLIELQNLITHDNLNGVYAYNFPNVPTTYFVLKNDSTIFWSRNYVDFSNLDLRDNPHWKYILLPNAHCLLKVVRKGNYKLAVLIKIKNKYSFENDQLQNTFVTDFNVDKSVGIHLGKSTDTHAVFGINNQYLFSLNEPKIPVYRESYAEIAMWAYFISFILFYILYSCTPKLLGVKYLSLTTFMYIFLFMSTCTLLCLYMNFPGLMFHNKLMSVFLYTSNPMLRSLTHLSIFTAFLLASICLFYYQTLIQTAVNKLIHYAVQCIYGCYFILLYYLLAGIISHSGIQISIVSFHDINVANLWIHFLIVLLSIGLIFLFFKTHKWIVQSKSVLKACLIDLAFCFVIFIAFFFINNNEAIRATVSYVVLTGLFYLRYIFVRVKNNAIFIALWTFAISCFFCMNSFYINNYRKTEKYKVLAQNIAINGNSDNDKMADILLEDLDKELSKDSLLHTMFIQQDSLTKITDYLNSSYLRGFWNKYEMHLNVTTAGSNVDREYQHFILNVGTHMKNTHFFSVPAIESNMSYIAQFYSGGIEHGKKLIYYLEFYPRRNFRSYSFPDLMVPTTPSIREKLKISIAKYERNRLVYSSGKYEYPIDNKWIIRKKTEFFNLVHNEKIHHIYVANADTYIVLTEEEPYHRLSYLIYIIYVFFGYFALGLLINWMHLIVTAKHPVRLGLSTKIQYSFIGMLLLSFLSIFYESVNFIEKKYRQEQIDNLENRKRYIQKALQDRYYWNQTLTEHNSQALDFDLQDLSSVYHTDIYVYNMKGILVGSSQPIMFNKSLMSNRIAPQPYFSQKANINQYEHLGNLNYLTGYSELINGDYVQIGYIAIPQYYSQDEIQNEIESFLTVIIHIYMIILFISIILSLFIGKQLVAPLIMLENKLKNMRLGRRNEKIEYKQNDEISQLVKQYNRTIDELELSARMLAKSERETAWKTMARQVAHEINNPLTPMKLSIQQLQRTWTLHDGRFDEYFERSTRMLVEQIDNLSRIAGTFSSFARMPEANFSRVDIAAKLVSVVQLFSISNENIHIQYEGLHHNVFAYADSEQLVQVFNNLLKNAIQSIPENSKGKILVRLVTDDFIRIDFIDNGCGIDDELKDKIFAPNFTTKNTGMGLGLAICKNIIEITGGTIQFESEVNVGTTFTVLIPSA